MLRLLLICIFLSSCTTRPARAPADEGFYSFPKPRAGYSTATINRVRASVGQLFIEKKVKYTDKEVQARRKSRCGSVEANYWMESVCAQLNSEKCVEGCEIEDFFAACSGGKIGSNFVTAKHCLPEGPNRMMAKFVDADGSLLEIPLIHGSRHSLPFDISILRPQSATAFARIPDLELASTMENGESVFGIGFPFVDESIRPRKNIDYEYVSVGMRITFGKIVDSNPEGLAYCHFSNSIDKAKPKNWVLEKFCAKIDKSKFSYAVREERNILLADTDMIYGMSGSLLFSVDGKVLGVGSTVKTSTPGNYSADKPAVYSKAANLRLIDSF